jgi:hypothetical protein
MLGVLIYFKVPHTSLLHCDNLAVFRLFFQLSETQITCFLHGISEVAKHAMAWRLSVSTFWVTDSAGRIVNTFDEVLQVWGIHDNRGAMQQARCHPLLELWQVQTMIKYLHVWCTCKHCTQIISVHFQVWGRVLQQQDARIRGVHMEWWNVSLPNAEFKFNFMFYYVPTIKLS